MQPIKHLNRGAENAPHHLETAALWLMALSVFFLWGPTQHYGHAFLVVIAAVVLAFLALPSVWAKTFGVFLAIWCAWIYSSAFEGLYFPELEGQTSDFILLITGGVAFFLTVYAGKRPLAWYQGWICTLSVILAAIGILQFLKFDMPAVALLGNQNFLGAWLAISLPFFLAGKWRFAAPLVVFALILTHTSTAVAAALAGVCWYYLGFKGFLIAIPAGAYYFYGVDNSQLMTSDRIGFWLDAVNTISGHWYTAAFGVGPGVPWRPDNMLHSEYAYMIYNFGGLGLALMAGWMVSVPRNEQVLYASFIAAAVDMIGNHVLHTAPTAILVIVIVALIYRKGRRA